eukprot:m.573202 g.573202  ORF g.573202 m.573202 type:complete len:69 (-) comp57874_c0_seq17:85-291(-)
MSMHGIEYCALVRTTAAAIFGAAECADLQSILVEFSDVDKVQEALDEQQFAIWLEEFEPVARNLLGRL